MPFHYSRFTPAHAETIVFVFRILSLYSLDSFASTLRKETHAPI